MRPHVLFVFLPRFEESHAMLRGIAHYERTHQLWAGFHDDQARAMTDPSWLRDKPWDGVISRHTTPAMAAICAEQGIPLVDLDDSPVIPGVPKIRPDNVALGHLGAEHFLERGHRHFAFAGFSSEVWSCERRAGFTEALGLAGHTCDLLEMKYPGDDRPVWDPGQLELLAAWLKRLPKPVGVLACMDLRAQQIMAAALEAELLVPDEVAILGINNDPTRCELCYPSLSSVAPNTFQSGYRAAEVLAGLLAGQDHAGLDERVEPIGVVTRRSTDVLAISDRTVATALGFIRERACQAITVDEVVRHAHTSRSQLERKFRDHLGRTPQAEIRRVQVAKIRQLLQETDFPLKKIAELAGFEHVEYMCVLFKRMTGSSPGAYRKLNHGGNSQSADRPKAR
ncbi:MAG: XylR family transcriptional regulator [Opitutaceae bacterium]|nr:XylR family transcriptional regulator [Opitutaceae bacterium]